ncbi:MAG: mscS [Myxococcales bacterium]|nr:mscS [Myxococcales bacterium]
MDELFDVLFHPARWVADAAELRPLTRLYLSLFIAAVAFGVALAVGWLSSRWAHRRTGESTSERNEETIRRLRRQLIALTLFFGAYLAVEVAPLPGRIAGWISGVAFVGGALVFARALIRLVALLLTSSVNHVNGVERSRLEREYVPLAEKATSLAVSLIFIIVVAKHFGKDVTSLVAALGVGSLAIGLAAQQTLGNMIAGFTLLVDRPFRPGDRIKLASGEVGEVHEIGVRSTRIVMADNNLLVVPNTELANSRVINYALPTKSTRGEVKVVIAYDADVDRATRILGELADGDQRIAKDPPPAVRVSAFIDRGVELTLGFHANTHVDAAAVEEKLRRGVLHRFAAEKVQIAYYRSSQGVPSGMPV